MLAQIQKNKVIELPVVTITGQRPEATVFEQRVKEHQQNMQEWMDSIIHPERLYPGDYGYTCSYWETYDYHRISSILRKITSK